MKTLYVILCIYIVLRALAANATGQLHVLWEDGDTPSMDGAQVGVLKERNQICLCRLLQSHESRRLEVQFALVFLSNLSNQTHERKLAKEKLHAPLVPADLPESDGAWSSLC